MHETLRAAGKIRAALAADGQQFINSIGERHEMRHAAKRFAAVIEIEPGSDQLLLLAQENLHDIQEIVGEELTFIDAYDYSLGRILQYISGGLYDNRLRSKPVARLD